MQYITFAGMHVKWSVILVVRLGLVILSALQMKGQVLHVCARIYKRQVDLWFTHTYSNSDDLKGSFAMNSAVTQRLCLSLAVFFEPFVDGFEENSLTLYCFCHPKQC